MTPPDAGDITRTPFPVWSVCICTHNRAPLLRQTLERLTQVRAPAGVRLEVVVVNNHSTDSTPTVLAEAAAVLPLHAVDEARPGIAYARNAAVAAAAGEVLVWIDDDVLVEPDWLESYAPAVGAHPEAGFFGGPVLPHLEGRPPDWLRVLLPELRQAYALRDFPAGTTRLTPDTLPYGANFVTRRALHRRFRFDVALGRVGASGGCLSEESAFFEEALRAGFGGWWVPEAPVRHVIPAARQTTRYLREYYAIAGATPGTGVAGSPYWFGRPRWLYRSLLQNEILYRLTRYLRPPPVWHAYLRAAAYARGALRRKWT